MTTIELPHPAPGDAPAPAPRAMADAPLPACESHSSISTYRSCPLRYGLRYVERRPGEVSPGQFAFGNAVHKAFEIFVRERIRARTDGAPEPGPDLLRDAFDRKIGSCGLAPTEVEDARRAAAPVLAGFLERERRAETVPIAVELGFGMPLELAGADGVRFVGYVDRVDRAPDGSIEIVDYKTGRARDQAEVDADPQLTAYAFACARGGLQDPATGETLPPAARLGLYFAESGELTWTTRSPVQVTVFGAALLETIGRIRAREFDPRPAPWRCRWCEYRRECPSTAPGAID